MNWHLQAGRLDSHSSPYLLNSHLIGCCSASLTFIPLLLLTCVNSLRVSVLTGRQRWTQSKSSRHIYPFHRLQQSMTISWIPVATETERDITTPSQTAALLCFILASDWNSAPLFRALNPPPAALGASWEASTARCPTLPPKTHKHRRCECSRWNPQLQQ